MWLSAILLAGSELAVARLLPMNGAGIIPATHDPDSIACSTIASPTRARGRAFGASPATDVSTTLPELAPQWTPVTVTFGGFGVGAGDIPSSHTKPTSPFHARISRGRPSAMAHAAPDRFADRPGGVRPPGRRRPGRQSRGGPGRAGRSGRGRQPERGRELHGHRLAGGAGRGPGGGQDIGRRPAGAG